MALEIVGDGGHAEPKDAEGGFALPEPIYETKDGRIVREADPDIHTLYRRHCHRISHELAVELGFVEPKPAAARAKKRRAPKPKRGSPEPKKD